jgi:hypothetical protein
MLWMSLALGMRQLQPLSMHFWQMCSSTIALTRHLVKHQKKIRLSLLLMVWP